MPKQTVQNKINHWNEWFAGITDGDGYFYINKKNEVSFEITTAINDSRILSNIKNKLKGGSIKLRSGSLSIRYRVKKQQIIKDICERLKGNLHNPKRLIQFNKVCHLFHIEPQNQSIKRPLNKTNAYLSGLLDSDGTVVISVSKSDAKNSQKSGKQGKIIRLSQSKGFNQFYIKITSKDKSFLEALQNRYQMGKVYSQKPNKKTRHPNWLYHWTINNKCDFFILYEYLQQYPLVSVKMDRIRLLILYFHYKENKYHLKPSETIEAKIWFKFCQSWFKSMS